MLRVDRSSPALVALTALFVYAAWVGWAHHIGHDWRDWAAIGKHFVGASEASPAILRDAPHATSTFGYDGQFFLYIARDPDGAVPYLDNASYRYGRIAYPLAARGLALGRQEAIPFALDRRQPARRRSGHLGDRRMAAPRALPGVVRAALRAFPGVFFGVRRTSRADGLFADRARAARVRRDGRAGSRSPPRSSLSRSSPARQPPSSRSSGPHRLAIQGRRLRAALFAIGSLLPYLVYRFMFLDMWLGNAGLPEKLRPTPVPFGGIGHYFPWGGVELQRVYAVLLPGTFCVALAVVALVRGARAPAVWALLANALLFVVFLPAAAYEDYASAGRISTGVFLAFLLSLPALTGVFPTTRAWMWLPTVAWFAPWYVLLPLALEIDWG